MGAVNGAIEFDWDAENARHLPAYSASRVYQELYWESRE